VVDVGQGTGFGSIPHDGITVNGIYEDVYVATTFDKRAPSITAYGSNGQVLELRQADGVPPVRSSSFILPSRKLPECPAIIATA
jgi:hypothetical protein